MSSRTRTWVVCFAVSVLALAGCTSSPPPPKRLTIGSGGTGGVYHLLGTALADAMAKRWNTEVTVRTTAASIENIRLLDEGAVDLAFATVDSAALAKAGGYPFNHEIKISALAGLYEDYLHIVVRAESTVRDITDLRGRRVSTGSAGSGTEVVAERILRTAGMNIDTDIHRHRRSVSESAQALRDGGIDAFFFTGGLPTPAIADLAATTRIRLVSIDKYLQTIREQYGDVYARRFIPPHMYGLGTQVSTIGITNVLLVRTDLPEPTAYQLTSLLFEARGELIEAHPQARRITQTSALTAYPIELHPGAKAYYRARKPVAVAAMAPSWAARSWADAGSLAETSAAARSRSARRFRFLN